MTALILGALLTAVPPAARAQPADAPVGEKNAYQFLDLTVQVRSAKADKPDEILEEGYGLIVAKGGALVTIVTADHVVRDPDGNLYGKVTVVPYLQRDRPRPAQVVEFRMPPQYGDLAVLHFAAPNWPALPALPVAKLPIARGTKAWRIGKEEGWVPTNRPGVYVGRQKTIWLGFDNLDTPRGSSGGPIVTNEGLIGMVTNDQSGRGYVLPVDQIIDFLTEQGAHWDLADPRKSSAPPAATVAAAKIDPASTAAAAAAPPPSRRRPPNR